jgi:DNA-binding PadR family transcriptional regulator
LTARGLERQAMLDDARDTSLPDAVPAAHLVASDGGDGPITPLDPADCPACGRLACWAHAQRGFASHRVDGDDVDRGDGLATDGGVRIDDLSDEQRTALGRQVVDAAAAAGAAIDDLTRDELLAFFSEDSDQDERSAPPGLYLVNATGTLTPLATEAGDGDRDLLDEVLDEFDADRGEGVATDGGHVEEAAERHPDCEMPICQGTPDDGVQAARAPSGDVLVMCDSCMDAWSCEPVGEGLATDGGEEAASVSIRTETNPEAFAQLVYGLAVGDDVVFNGRNQPCTVTEIVDEDGRPEGLGRFVKRVRLENKQRVDGAVFRLTYKDATESIKPAGHGLDAWCAVQRHVGERGNKNGWGRTEDVHHLERQWTVDEGERGELVTDGGQLLDGRPDGAAHPSTLTQFETDILRVLACGDNYGLGIKDALEAYYGEQVNHGKLYPHLDTLVRRDLVDKGQRDRRTNDYRLTGPGRATLQARINWLAAPLQEVDGDA